MSLANNTFDFEIPSRETSSEFTPNVYSVQFGGRYKQTAAAGINNVAGKWTVVFNNLPRAKLLLMDAFLRAHSGGESFLWLRPQPYNAAAALMRCVDPWKPSWQPGGLLCDVTFTFEEV